MSQENVFSLSLNTILADSKEAGYQSKPSWTLSDPQSNITAFQVDSFVAPNSVFTIDDRNNRLYWTEYTGTTGTVLQTTVPTSYYNTSTLTTALASAFNTFQTNGNYQVALTGASSLYFMVTNTTSNFIMSGENEYHNINYETGFMDTTSQTIANNQVASQTLDLSGLKQINIVSSNLGVSHSFTANSGYKIITNIPVNAPFGGTIIYAGDQQFASSPIQSLNNFSCELFDERFRSLRNSNMSDFCMTMFLKSL